jgi:hypothetical protein
MVSIYLSIYLSIYSDSYLTIAAAVAKDCHSGLCPTSRSSQPYANFEGPFSGSLCAYRLMPYVNDNNDYPLLTRGWVHRERILSPCVLYFAGKEMNWECRAESWCKCGGITDISCDKGRVEQRLKKLEQHLLMDDNLDREDEESVSDTQLAWWIEAVQRYLSLNLTYPKDIFPALAGLASYT